VGLGDLSTGGNSRAVRKPTIVFLKFHSNSASSAVTSTQNIMPLVAIVWNDLYAAKKHKHIFSEVRIQIHYEIMGLECRGATTAIVG
jgi:hypothetical protein